MDFFNFTITENDNNRRLDRVIRRFLPDISLSNIYKYIRKNLIRYNNQKTKPDVLVQTEHTIQIARFLIKNEFSDINVSENHFYVIPSSIEVLCETNDLLIINKPIGVTVHGSNSIDSLIPQSIQAKNSLSFKSGPLHRLDKDTSGLLVFSKTLYGAQWFSEQIAKHTIQKIYLGIVVNALNQDTTWRTLDIQGKQMITHVHPLLTNKQYTLVQFMIKTGKKHQIRIQAKEHQFPLYGDSKYGSFIPKKTYSLHAWKLIFPKERPQDLPLEIIAPLSQNFISTLFVLFTPSELAKIQNTDIY